MKKTFLTIISILFSLTIFSQVNTIKSETHSFKVVKGKIVIELAINGKKADFILDLGGRTSVLPEYVEKLGMGSITEAKLASDVFFFKNLPVTKKSSINSISFGNNVYANGLQAFILEGESADYLREIGVAGVISGTLFSNVVLTIDKRHQTIYTSLPFRPQFMSLTERADCKIVSGSTPELTILVDGKPLSLIFSTWYNGLISLNSENIIKGVTYENDKGEISGTGYEASQFTGKTFRAKEISLVNVKIYNGEVTVNPNLVKSEAGLALLDYGIISVDFSKEKIYFQSYEKTVINKETKPDLLKIEHGKLNAITKDEFTEYIYDYKNNNEFKLKGDKPVIIDFWASWCGPCMSMLPLMEQLAEKYKDKIVFYKVNADKEKELCSIFNVVALPTLFIVSPGKAPIIEVGYQQNKLLQLIEDLVK